MMTSNYTAEVIKMNPECNEMARHINKPKCWNMNKYECNKCPDRISCNEKK